MPRYIDADALKDVIQQHDYLLSDKLNCIGNGMFTLGIFQAIDHMPTVSPDEARGVGKWISVDERLPKKDEMVIVYYSWTGQSGTVYKEVSLATVEEMKYCGNKLIGWMPLPEPPKEDAE